MPRVAVFLGIRMGEIKKAEKLQMERIQTWIDRRLKSNEPFRECVFDRILQYNQECVVNNRPEKAYSLFDIYGTVNLIAFAATDTSLKAATMAVCDMTGRPEVKRILD